MRTRLQLIVLGLLFLNLVGCSTPESRVKDNEALFKTLSPEDQGKIRGGHIDIGFTPEMVTMALGDPDRRYTRTTAQGVDQVWAYKDRSPNVSFGLGVGGGGTALGLGVASGDRRDDRARIIFHDGRVVAIERRGSG